MSFDYRITQTLHEEHCATTALLERLDHILLRFRQTDLPDAKGDAVVARLLADLSIALEFELNRHFVFEEERLIPLLGAAGDLAIGALLTDEHAVMRPVVATLGMLVREIRTKSFDAIRWTQFRRLGLELCDRLRSHIQKEDVGFLPALDQLIDAETAAALYEDYIESS